jgi:hypothetical protein
VCGLAVGVYGYFYPIPPGFSRLLGFMDNISQLKDRDRDREGEGENKRKRARETESKK